MTTQQKNDYWLRFHRFQKRYEAIYLPRIKRALKEQVQQYIDNGTVLAVTSTPLYPVLLDLYKTVGLQWAHKSDVARRRLKARMPMGFSERIVQLMQQYYGINLLNDAEGITQTTREAIQKILTAGAAEGLGFDEMVMQIQASTAMNPARARLITRTETVAAANAGAMAQAKETGVKLNKIWISARDRRTRLDHREVDNHVVGLDEDFNVGGFPMSQPGDKRGTAKEVCNCRCVLAFIDV